MATKAELENRLREAKAEIRRLKLELKAVSANNTKSPSKPLKATKKSAFSRFKEDYPEICSELFRLLREWNLPTRNMNNTVGEIRKLIEPDEAGIVATNPESVVFYLKILRRIGTAGYYSLKNKEDMEKYYKLYDSIVLFKHFNILSDMILQRYYPEKYQQKKTGYKTHRAVLKDKDLGRDSVICSWSDLNNQKLGEEHRNDELDLSLFDGEDLIREVYRRRKKKFGYLDKDSVQNKIDYEYNQRFHKEEKQDTIVLSLTEIAEEDDDISLNDFEEVK